MFCVLKKVWGVRMCDISENLKTCENGEMMSPFALYRKLKWVGIILLKNFRKKPIHWICEIAHRLEYLIALCEPRNVNSKSEVRELSTPHEWIEESCGLMSWKSKPCFFSFDEREKPKFWGAIVGAKVQNSYVLGLGLARVQIDKYWILVLIREPEFPRRYECKVKDY